MQNPTHSEPVLPFAPMTHIDFLGFMEDLTIVLSPLTGEGRIETPITPAAVVTRKLLLLMLLGASWSESVTILFPVNDPTRLFGVERDTVNSMSRTKILMIAIRWNVV